MKAVGYVRRSVRSDERRGLPATIPKMKRLAKSGIRKLTLLIAHPLRCSTVQEVGAFSGDHFPLENDPELRRTVVTRQLEERGCSLNLLRCITSGH